MPKISWNLTIVKHDLNSELVCSFHRLGGKVNHQDPREHIAFRILFVEDDLEIAEFVAQGLREEGFLVEQASDGYSGGHALSTSTWDLVILDWWLPGPNGLTLLKEFRQLGKTTPVLFLTARDAVAQRVEGLTAGTDDYLCKPFAFEELLARVQALLRRLPVRIGTEWRHQDVILDLSTNRAERAGKPLGLTSREQALLLFFMRHPMEVLSRTRLYEQVWQDQYDGLSNTLEVHVSELHRKLEAHGARLIHTIRGRGYLLGDPTSPESEAT